MDFLSSHLINYYPLLGAFIILFIGQFFKSKKEEDAPYKKYTKTGWALNFIFPFLALLWGAIGINSTEIEKTEKERIRKSDSVYDRKRWQADSLKLLQITDTLNRTTRQLNEVYLSSQQLLNKLNSEIDLAQESLKKIKKVDTKTEREFEVTGQFHFPIDSTLPGSSLIVSYLGDRRLGDYNFPELKGSRLLLLNLDRIKIYTANYEFVVNAQIFDLYGHEIVNISENRWRINKNSISRFNYDERGFEIYDNAGRIVINIDFKIKDPKSTFGPSVHVQGIIPINERELGYYNDNYYFNFWPGIPYGTEQEIKQFYHLYDSVPIKPLFEYTGENWRGTRKK